MVVGMRIVETTPELDTLLLAGAPVAIGVSGGGDSDLAGFETMRYLDSIGHTGPRVLIHSDLGRVEWRESLPQCERLAVRLGLELVVVKRKSGDLMDRWLVRWHNNCKRYAELSCVKMILPWSTPSMRFCTSELKTSIICRDLVERFPGKTIISVAGIRRDESPKRALAPIVAEQSKLESKTFATIGFDWHPILAWTKKEVFDYHQEVSFPLHSAYTEYGSTRVSCCYCILGSLHDLIASAKHPENQDIYREMVELEAISAFSFQDKQWLGDIAPELLDESMIAGVKAAKQKVLDRERIECAIPHHLLYTAGWPTILPTYQEAEILAQVRRQISELYMMPVQYTDADSIRDRYQFLMDEKARKDAEKARKTTRKVVLARTTQQDLYDSVCG